MVGIRSPVFSAVILRLTRPGTRARAAGPVTAADMLAAVADMLKAAKNMAVEDIVAAVVGMVAEEDTAAVKVAAMATKCRRWKKAMLRLAEGNREGTKGRLTLRVLCISLVLGLSGIEVAMAQAPGQMTFKSVKAASDAFAIAAQNHDEPAMLAILGPSGKDLISSGDPIADRNKQDTFALNYSASHQYATAADGRTFLYIGANNWPTPIPLQKNGSQWYFDTDYGKQEILYRRIGADELNVIKVCAAIVDAQRDYYGALHDGALEHQYAQRFRSTAGTQDGLYWEVKAGAEPPESPLGPLVVQAAMEGYEHHANGQLHPFHGYIYRLLTSQGPSVPGGVRNYIVDGKMTGGFGLLAYPVTYRDTGVMTFIVNQDGQVYQKDLGPDTAQIASEMAAYDPNSTWQATDKATVAAQTTR